MANLYIIATPIGNLGDITVRALEILKRADFILCEDTRVTKKLLAYYQIKAPTISYHQHSKLQKIDYIINLLRQGKNLALVSDAGTPGISDPGNKLIQQITESAEEIAGVQPLQVEIISVPGASAITAAASISGFPMDKFLFLGFPPHKKARNKFFKEIAESKYPVIFFESPHRVIKSLKQLEEIVSNVEIIVGRELTKKFETIYRGTINKVIKRIENPLTGEKIKGEFVVIVKKHEREK
jgi:16S rRNA (cytidine1402-2'-O)-methyltransferase